MPVFGVVGSFRKSTVSFHPPANDFPQRFRKADWLPIAFRCFTGECLDGSYLGAKQQNLFTIKALVRRKGDPRAPSWAFFHVFHGSQITAPNKNVNPLACLILII